MGHLSRENDGKRPGEWQNGLNSSGNCESGFSPGWERELLQWSLAISGNSLCLLHGCHLHAGRMRDRNVMSRKEVFWSQLLKQFAGAS